MHSKCEQTQGNQEEKQQLGEITFYDISIMFSEWGCEQTSSALVGEFVHLGKARPHLQKILHSSRWDLLKLQKGLTFFKPALSISDKEISQAVLILLHIRRAGKVCSEEGIRVTGDGLILAMGFRCHREAQGGSHPHTDTAVAHHNITEPWNGLDWKEPKR